MAGIEVLSESGLGIGDSTQGIVRKTAFRHDGIALGKSTIAPDAESDWHHHGTGSLYGILLEGQLRFDFGSSGKKSVTVGPGDFFHIPVGLVHRDVNPGLDRPAVVASVLVGKGPSVVNVADPER